MAEEVLQTQITRPSPIIEEGQKAYLEALRDQVKTPLATSAFAPGVVSRGALEQAAQQQAATQAGLGTLGFDQQGAISTVGTGTGIAGFQPFLDAASTAATQAGTDIASARGMVGPTAYQQFLSPYQTAVRDATLASFDEQAAARQQAISDQAVALGGFGGGREGVQLAEYQRKSDLDRALLQAQLNQQGFTQAQQLAGQAFQQFGNLGQLQQGLGSQQAAFAQLQPSLAAQNIGMVGQLGQQDFSFRQAQADAAREAERMRQFEPIDRLARLGQGITGLTPGGGTVTTTTGVPAAAPSPIGSALTAGIGAFGLGKLFGFSKGGRVGFQDGTPSASINEGTTKELMANMDIIALEFMQKFGYDIMLATPDVRENFIQEWKDENFYNKSEAPTEKRIMAAKGGRVRFSSGTPSASIIEIMSLLETLPFDQRLRALEMLPPSVRAEVEKRLGMAKGGRVGFSSGTPKRMMRGMEGMMRDIPMSDNRISVDTELTSEVLKRLGIEDNPEAIQKIIEKQKMLREYIDHRNRGGDLSPKQFEKIYELGEI